MTDTEIRDGINCILFEQFGTVLKNREITTQQRVALLDKLITLLTEPRAKAAGGRG